MRSVDAIVLLSGGIDSAACAHFLKRQGHAIHGIFIDYGQAAAALEQRAATALAEHLNAPLRVYCVSGSDGFSGGELVGRNAFLLLSALFLSRARSGLLAIGIHAGTPYFDCSSRFVDIMARVIAEHTNDEVRIVVPFLNWTKRDVFEYFISSGLPIGSTYSCEAGSEPSCGVCASCRDRRALGC